jgi:hypothetical protein
MKSHDALPLLEEREIVCRRLRTKSAFGAVVSDEAAWQSGASTTAVYWCLDTMEPVGPDDDSVDAHRCRSGRECFHSSD